MYFNVRNIENSTEVWHIPPGTPCICLKCEFCQNFLHSSSNLATFHYSECSHSSTEYLIVRWTSYQGEAYFTEKEKEFLCLLSAFIVKMAVKISATSYHCDFRKNRLREGDVWIMGVNYVIFACVMKLQDFLKVENNTDCTAFRCVNWNCWLIFIWRHFAHQNCYLSPFPLLLLILLPNGTATSHSVCFFP